MSPARGWRPWKTTAARESAAARETLRARLAGADRAAAAGELWWATFHNAEGRVEISPCGDWRDKVIVAESFAEVGQLDADEPEPGPGHEAEAGQ